MMSEFVNDFSQRRHIHFLQVLSFEQGGLSHRSSLPQQVLPWDEPIVCLPLETNVAEIILFSSLLPQYLHLISFSSCPTPTRNSLTLRHFVHRYS
jgi:hypothetical protein